MARKNSGSYIMEGAGWQLLIAGEYGMIIRPTYWKGDGSEPAALYCAGLSAGANNLRGWYAGVRLAQRGVLVLCSDLGDTPSVARTAGIPASVGGSGSGGPGVWGNDYSMGKLDALYNLALTRYGASGPKIILMGGSQGGATSARWAGLNPNKVSALLHGIPAINIQDIVTNNRNPGTAVGYRASVQQAYGLGSGLALPAGVTGIESAAHFTFPTRVYYSTTDGVTPDGQVQAFQAASPEEVELISLGAIGHSLIGMDHIAGADWALRQHYENT